MSNKQKSYYFTSGSPNLTLTANALVNVVTYTPTIAGRYTFSGSMCFSPSTVTNESRAIFCGFFKNAGDIVGGYTSHAAVSGVSANYSTNSASAMYDLVVGDSVYFATLQADTQGKLNTYTLLVEWVDDGDAIL